MATLGLAWPLIFANLAQIALTTTDVIFMGLLGADSLASGTIGANLYLAFYVIGVGIATATAPMLAQAIGHRCQMIHEARLIIRQGLWCTLGYTIVTWLVLWQAESLLCWLGQSIALAHSSALYLHTLQWGLLPSLWFLVLRSFVAALEQPKPALVVTLGGVMINAAVCWILMFGHFGAPRMELAGAGIASTLANSFMALALLTVVLTKRRFRRFHLLSRGWLPNFNRMRELMRIGLPMSIACGFEITVFCVASLLMGVVGSQALAAHAIAIQLATISFMVPLGIGQAATIRVGLATGATDHRGIAYAGWTAIALGCGFMAMMAIVLTGMPLVLVGLLLDTTNPANDWVVHEAISFLSVAGAFQIADGAQSVCAGVLRGLKDTRVPMIFAGIGYWGVGIPVGVLFAFPGGLGGARYMVWPGRWHFCRGDVDDDTLDPPRRVRVATSPGLRLIRISHLADRLRSSD